MEALRAGDPAETGGYRLLARLGAGGMGQVYLGLSPGGRHVAIKVIRSDFDSPEALARFRREVATVGELRSPFTAALVGAGLDAPPYWLATEYVQGPTLAQAVARYGPLPVPTCLRLMAALGEALADVHARGVQHRDLKPHNVILAPDGPRLIDFGIARGDDQTAITHTGAAAGTPGYLAPEVIQWQRMSPAADVFALAGTIAYAATGRPPFGVGDAHAVIYRSVHAAVDVAGVEPGLAGLIARCAEKDPAARPAAGQVPALCGVQGAITDDPAYRRLLDLTEVPPPDLPTAVAHGLVPPGHGQATGVLTQSAPALRSRRTLLGMIGGGAAAAVVAGVLLFQFAPGLGDKGGSHSTQGTGQAGTGGTGAGGRSPSTGTTGSPTRPTSAGKPTDVFSKETDPDFQVMAWKDGRCTPPVRTESSAEPLSPQWSAPREPVAPHTSVDVGFRSKYGAPAGYYIAAEMRPPVGMGGNEVTGIVKTRPVLLKASDDTTLRYPKDFTQPKGWAYDLERGAWTVIWYHVHSNGNAYYIGCDGFTVS
ncbi:serine/threonine protein kinase [Actinoallomurus purpureus]|uniref:serine/threonine-protein kinase n=1 Tax=Actinoallomurus purpureus TaxID=478114 RepID=UPI0020937628|nr:serine/threonine-protein kinase [Actinoallomurus purpureus]MCO6004223.1 serine/threonine protein kinase [Actinoallomurus purpureus]